MCLSIKHGNGLILLSLIMEYFCGKKNVTEFVNVKAFTVVEWDLWGFIRKLEIKLIVAGDMIGLLLLLLYLRIY